MNKVVINGQVFCKDCGVPDVCMCGVEVISRGIDRSKKNG